MGFFPWWAALGLAGVMLLVVIRRGRMFKSVWAKVKRGDVDLDDDWDPFK